MPSDTAFRRDLSSKLVSMHGRRTALDGDLSTVWPGSGDHPVFPTVEVATEIISSDAADDGAPVGTGARTVTIYYLDDGFVERSSTLTMNGTTAVVGPADFYRLQRMVVATVGSGGVAAGTITLQTLTSGASVYGVIPLGANESHSAYRTVPVAKSYIPRYLGSSVTSGANTSLVSVELQATVHPETKVRTAGIWHTVDQFRNEDQSSVGEYPPIKFPAGTDIRFVAQRTLGSAAGQVDLHMWFEEV